jgi:hypothetical protein
MMRIGIATVALNLCATTTLAVAQNHKIDGYDGYKFRMTLDQARKANPEAKQTKCDYVNVDACLEYSTHVGPFPAAVTVQFSGTPPLLTQILLTFRSLDDTPLYKCQDITKELLELLVTKYKERPFVEHRKVTWTSPNGGAVQLTSLCLDAAKGINIITYMPSNPL